MALYGHAALDHPGSDPNIFQGYGPYCAIRCQELILRDFGIQIPEQELKDFATERNWFSEMGTPRSQICNLLKECGVDMHTSYGNTVDNLVNELSQGHRIIVSVDAMELGSQYGSEQWAQYESVKAAGHVVIVSGINIDEADPSRSTVIVTDPGHGTPYKEYRLDHFVKAWEDSDCYMAASDEAAPYQYNALTQSMEYSDFATDYSVGNFPFHNEFSDIWHMHATNQEPLSDPTACDSHNFDVFNTFKDHSYEHPKDDVSGSADTFDTFRTHSYEHPQDIQPADEPYLSDF